MPTRHAVLLALALAVVASPPPRAASLDAQATQTARGFSADDVFGYPFPADLTAAASAGRIASSTGARRRRTSWPRSSRTSCAT